MTRANASREKRAELVGSSGAGVLGAGLGALLAQWLSGYALALVAVGVVWAWIALKALRG